MKKILKKTAAVVVAILVAAGIFQSAAVVFTNAQPGGFAESKKLWIIGDSIASKHDDNSVENEVPITGWGNVLQSFLSEVEIINKARSGRSAKSYINERDYKDVMKEVAAGDYLIIQFGHNDEKERSSLYSDPNGTSDTEESFKWYLKTKYIEPCMERGARVILASSVVRRTFNEDGTLQEQTHEPYARAMKELSQEYQDQGKTVCFIDTFAITREWYTRLGKKRTGKFHAVIGRGDSKEMDNTHYGPYGAAYMASTIAKQLKELGIACCQNIKSIKVAETNKAVLEANRAAVRKFSWR